MRSTSTSSRKVRKRCTPDQSGTLGWRQLDGKLTSAGTSDSIAESNHLRRGCGNHKCDNHFMSLSTAQTAMQTTTEGQIQRPKLATTHNKLRQKPLIRAFRTTRQELLLLGAAAQPRLSALPPTRLNTPPPSRLSTLPAPRLSAPPPPRLSAPPPPRPRISPLVSVAVASRALVGAASPAAGSSTGAKDDLAFQIAPSSNSSLLLQGSR